MNKVLSLFFVLAILLTACGGGDSGLGSGEVGNTREKTASTDKMEMILIPGGVFQMGGLNDKAQPDEEPDHKITLKSYWLDKTEVTNAQYAMCVAAGNCDIPNELKSSSRDSYFNNPEFADTP